MIHSCKMRKPKKTNNKTTKKKQENQEDLLGQSASDIVFFCFLVFVLNFACPKGRMQRVESCHLFAVLHAPREGCRELSLVICLFLVSLCICQNREYAKRNAKSARWWSPVLFF